LTETKDAARLLDAFLRDLQYAGGGQLELRADQSRDEVAFRSPWELIRVGDGICSYRRQTVDAQIPMVWRP
jgi:hypothetical protein